MAVLGSGVLMLSASADGFQKDLKKAGGSVTDFNQKVKAVPDVGDKFKAADRSVVKFYDSIEGMPEIKIGDTKNDIVAKMVAQRKAAGNEVAAFNRRVQSTAEIGEKVTATFGRLAQVGSIFTLMSSNASTLEKSIASVNVGVGAMTIGLQLATKVTSGLKAAFLGTGVGALVVGLGWIIGKLTQERKAAEPAAAREREEWEKFLDRINETATRDTRPAAVWTERISPDVFTRERERALRPAAELGVEADRFASSLRETERAAGRSREEMTLLDLTARATAMGLGPLIESADAYRSVLLDIVDAPLRPVLDSVLDDAEAARRVVSEIVDARRALLAIDVRREADRLGSPMDAVIAEIARMEDLVARGGPVGLLEEGLRRLIGISPDPLISSLERIRVAALRLGDADARTRAVDIMARIAGEPSSALETFHARVDRHGSIDRAAEEMRRVAVPGIAMPWLRSSDTELEGRIDRMRGRAFLDLERASGVNAERAAPQALLEGSAQALSAINAARRNAVSTDPILRVERVLERMERIEADERSILTEIGRALSVVRRV